MTKRYHFEPASFSKKYLPLLWAAMLPSLVVDAILIYRTAVKLISNNGNSASSLLIDLVMMMIMNAALLKSVPLIIYFVHRSNLKQSVVTITKDVLVYQQRLLSVNEFNYGFTFYHEHHLVRIDSFRQRKNGSLVINGEHDVHCLQEDGEPVTDFCKGDLKPRILRRKRCVIPAVFEGMDEITAKLNELAAVFAAA